jgi:hypothetical protein
MADGGGVPSVVSFDQTTDATFHGVEYTLHAYVQADHLCIEAEQKSNGDRWTGQFSASSASPIYPLPTCQTHSVTAVGWCRIDIEALTKKTENSKKFAVFVKMLSTALSRANETVFIDLLTTADLEMLKARKTGLIAYTSRSPLPLCLIHPLLFFPLVCRCAAIFDRRLQRCGIEKQALSDSHIRRRV